MSNTTTTLMHIKYMNLSNIQQNKPQSEQQVMFIYKICTVLEFLLRSLAALISNIKLGRKHQNNVFSSDLTQN